jgi:hypothetical protein
MSFKMYLNDKIKRAFRVQTVVNSDTAVLLILMAAVASAYYVNIQMVAVCFMALFAVFVYKDYKSGHWMGNIRMEYTITGMDRKIKLLEEENKKLRENSNGK